MSDQHQTAHVSRYRSGTCTPVTLLLPQVPKKQVECGKESSLLKKGSEDFCTGSRARLAFKDFGDLHNNK